MTAFHLEVVPFQFLLVDVVFLKLVEEEAFLHLEVEELHPLGEVVSHCLIMVEIEPAYLVVEVAF